MRAIPMLLTSIRRHRHPVCVLFLLVFLATMFLLPAMAAAQGPKPATPPARQKATQPAKLPAQPAAAPEMTAADVGAFLDGVMPLQLQREDIAGAVVLVVKDGKVLFKKGYGYADVAKKTPVSPDTTLFRPGSVSKLFTWTAVMQQVEAGKIDLDRDINAYLDFHIPPYEGRPVTMRNLMTHTPGFEEAVQELFVSDPKRLTPIADYLKAHLPNRVYAPGAVPAYSNYGATLAGYIVQRVSGEPFDDYVEAHIFKPLGMNHTTFRQPLPDPLKSMMSNGYQVGSQPNKPFEFVEAEPAGSSSVTADDISRFIIAHLQDGKYENRQILRPETAQLMHAAQFKNLPQLNGMALGFYEETRNGHRIIGHAGDTQYFHSDLHLVPDASVGFFISYNSAGKGETSPRTAVWEKFLDRYFPYRSPDAPAVATAKQDAKAVAGHYIVSRRGDSTLMKVLNVAGETKVIANSDGTVSVKDVKDINGQPKKFREIAPLVYREVDGQDMLGFKRDASGRLVMALGETPFFVFQKARWYENSALQLPLIVGALIVFVLTLLIWPVAALVRRHYGSNLSLDASERRLRRAVRIVCILDIVFAVAFVGFFSMSMNDIGMLSPRYNGWIRFIQVIGWLGVIGTLLALYNALRSWTSAGRWWWSRVWETVIGLACVAFVWFVFTWNMLHWSLRY